MIGYIARCDVCNAELKTEKDTFGNGRHTGCEIIVKTKDNLSRFDVCEKCALKLVSEIDMKRNK